MSRLKEIEEHLISNNKFKTFTTKLGNCFCMTEIKMISLTNCHNDFNRTVNIILSNTKVNGITNCHN